MHRPNDPYLASTVPDPPDRKKNFLHINLPDDRIKRGFILGLWVTFYAFLFNIIFFLFVLRPCVQFFQNAGYEWAYFLNLKISEHSGLLYRFQYGNLIYLIPVMIFIFFKKKLRLAGGLALAWLAVYAGAGWFWTFFIYAWLFLPKLLAKVSSWF